VLEGPCARICAKEASMCATRESCASVKESFIVAKGLYRSHPSRGGGLGSRPKKMYGERLGDGVEYHLMSPTPRR